MALYKDITKLAHALLSYGTISRPFKIDELGVSTLLFDRLCSNNTGFSLLWQADQNLEAEIVLRPAVEAAICIAALYKSGDDFVQLIREDAASTVDGQKRHLHATGRAQLAKEGEEIVSGIKATIPNVGRPNKLDWKTLASTGEVNHFYSYHRMLSSTSSHVTGISILRNVAADEAEERRMRNTARQNHLLMMAEVLLQACLHHAAVIDAVPEAEQAVTLFARLHALPEP